MSSGNSNRNQEVEQPPSVMTEAVLKPSTKSYCQHLNRASGYTFENDKGEPELDYKSLLDSLRTTGFQATHYGRAVDIVSEMLRERDQPFNPDMNIEDEMIRPRTACTIFLSYTSNMISSGLRENIRFLIKNKLVNCVVTTASEIEEDLIK